MRQNFNPNDPLQGGWYKDINPNEHEYTLGYGFSNRPPFLVERREIGSYAGFCSLAVFGFFVLGMILPKILFSILSNMMPSDFYLEQYELIVQLVTLLTSIASLTLPFCMLCSVIKIPMACRRPMRSVSLPLAASAVGIALAVAAVAMYATAVLMSVFSAMGINYSLEGMNPPKTIPAYVVYAINMTVLPAVFEELAFRGSIMQPLRRFGDSFALLCSSLLFALVHLLPVRFPNAFLMGLVIGYFVLFTGSIKTGIIIHFVHNLLILIQVTLGEFDLAVNDYLGIVISIFSLAAGLLALIWLMHRYTGLFVLNPSQTINGEAEKLRTFWLHPAMVLLVAGVVVMSMSYLV